MGVSVAARSLLGRRIATGRWLTTGAPAGPSFEYKLRSPDDDVPRKTCTVCGFINCELAHVPLPRCSTSRGLMLLPIRAAISCRRCGGQGGSAQVKLGLLLLYARSPAVVQKDLVLLISSFVCTVMLTPGKRVPCGVSRKLHATANANALSSQMKTRKWFVAPCSRSRRQAEICLSLGAAPYTQDEGIGEYQQVRVRLSAYILALPPSSLPTSAFLRWYGIDRID